MYPAFVTFTIEGEPASKANSRKLIIFNGKIRFAKSAPALSFEKTALLQVPHDARVMYPGPVRVTLRIFYRNERRDLDESVVLDVLQARYAAGGARVGALLRRGVYVNDRQVREKHVFHAVDARRPRVQVTVEPMEGDQ